MSNLQQLRNDVVEAARLAEVEYSEVVIDRVFESFGDKFAKDLVDLKTTTKPLPKRGMYFRYLEKNERCLAWERACQSRLLIPQERPVDRLVPEVREQFPLKADGIDFEVNYGLAKIWLVPQVFFQIEEVLKLASLPERAKESVGFFKSHDLQQAHIIAADYQHNSMNLYFPIVAGGYRPSQFYRDFLRSLNFQIPASDLLELFAKTVGLAVTFSWHSNNIERVCFYVPGSKREQILAYTDSSSRAFVLNCPALPNEPDFILGWSFGLNNSSTTYIKLELDYSGHVSQFCQDIMLSRVF